jgi:hypothetical protein
MNERVQSRANPVPKPSFAPVRSNLLQSKCACGGTPGLDGECAECRRKRLLGSQRAVSDQADQTEVPLIVDGVLRSPGQPLDASTRASSEATFGHGFSKIPGYPKVPVKTQTKQAPMISEEQQASASAIDFGKIMAHASSRQGNFFTSLTTGDDDERVFQTAVGDVDTAPSNSFNTQLPGPGGAPPGLAAGPAGSHHCVPTVVKSSLPSGHIAATASGGRFAAPFNMTADFDAPIPCTGRCGEYRQFVSGFSQVNGTDIVHPLCSNNMSRTTEYEDCLTSGGTNLKYGYHSIPFSNSRFTNPDQATGFSFRGYDAPGFNLAAFPSGTVLNWNLSFRGALVDACDGDRPLQPSATWTAGGSYTVP